MRLSDTACKNAKPGDKTYKMSDGDGMYLEVRPNGAKYWRMRYRFKGKQKTLAIGVYPETSLRRARQIRDEAREQLAEGIDPSQHKQERKRQAFISAENTFEAIAREWHENNLESWSENHAKDVFHRLAKDVFPEIGHRPIAEITSPEMLAVIRKIETRGVNDMARRALQMSGQVFRYAIITGRAENDPTKDLKGALKPAKKKHYPAIDVQELPEFLRILYRNDARLYAQTRYAIELMLLTFVRTSELINARWNEINFQEAEWMIPAERMKMEKAHIVPLSRQAMDVLRNIHEITGNQEYVFASQARPNQPISNNTILKALERMGYAGRMTGHGFRSLAMSAIKEKLGYRHEVVDRQLAHAPRSKIDAAYDRAQFLEDRRQMMQAWADYIDRLA